MELIIVIGIIAVLALIVAANINPTKNLAEARNSQRRSDVGVLMNATHQYLLDTGALPTTIPLVTLKEICKGGAAGLPCSNGVRLTVLSGTYLAGIPVDPLAPLTGTGTRYYISKDTLGRVTIVSAYAERNESIFLTR